MNPLLSTVLELLPTYGPGLLFVLAILETSFVTGFMVPSGLATSAATVLALEGRLQLAPVVAAAVLGGTVGDNVGYWIGRAWGRQVMRRGGLMSRALGRRRAALDLLFGRHPLYSVTTARLIAFARTAAPLAAGMSGLSYRRYVPYQLLGVLGWGTMYVTIGVVARESWQAATRLVGGTGVIVFSLVGVLAWRIWVRRARERRAGVAGSPTDAAGAEGGRGGSEPAC